MKVWIAKQGFKIIGKITDKVLKARALKRLKDYVEKDNELDIQMKQVQKNNPKILKENENMQKENSILKSTLLTAVKEIVLLKKDSHPPQEFICCRRCGGKINKTKSKKRR